MAKRRSGVLSIDVYCSEVLDELSDEDLLQELEDRKLGPKSADPMQDLQDIKSALLRGKPAEALAIVDLLLHPKWHSRDACAAAFQAQSIWPDLAPGEAMDTPR